MRRPTDPPQHPKARSRHLLIAFLCGGFVALAGCVTAFATPPVTKGIYGGVIIVGRGAAGATLGMTRAQVIARLGRPLRGGAALSYENLPLGKIGAKTPDGIFDLYLANARVRTIVISPHSGWRLSDGNHVFASGAIARLMHREGLWARQRSKYRVATTDSRHNDPIAPNRLLGLKAERPDQVWVTDATCILTGQGWLYVVAVLDVYTRRVLGWGMHDHLEARLTIAALQMAITRRRPRPGVIVHSDRGTQFASAAYRQVLADHGLLASMSRRGNCYDNAFMESFWSSLKYEVVYHHRFATRLEARTAVFDYIETFYNRTRLHSSLGYLSPITFESQLN